MNILTNWLFWVILVSIIFILALIGYLTENVKKSKDKQEENVSQPESVAEEPVQPVQTFTNEPLSPAEPSGVLNLDNGTWSNEVKVEPTQVANDDWSVMPQAAPIQPEMTQVQTPIPAAAQTAPAMPDGQPAIVEPLATSAAPAVEPVQTAPVNQNPVASQTQTMPVQPNGTQQPVQTNNSSEIWK